MKNSSANANNTIKSNAIEPNPAPFNITALNASFAYVRGKNSAIFCKIHGIVSVGKNTPHINIIGIATGITI